MTAAGVTLGRRISAATRLQVQLVFARALEALAETYQQQAADFVRRLRSRPVSYTHLTLPTICSV